MLLAQPSLSLCSSPQTVRRKYNCVCVWRERETEDKIHAIKRPPAFHYRRKREESTLTVFFQLPYSRISQISLEGQFTFSCKFYLRFNFASGSLILRSLGYLIKGYCPLLNEFIEIRISIQFPKVH